MPDNTETTPDRLFEDTTSGQHRRHIRWDPTINTGHIVSASTSIIAALVFTMASWATMDKRVVVLEEARLAQIQANQERATQLKEKFDEIREGQRDTRSAIESLRRDIQQQQPRSR